MKNILFICEGNKQRSPTAEALYKRSIYTVKSAGISHRAYVVVDEQILQWADRIFVMEKRFRNKIRKRWPHIYKEKSIICLYIPDDFDFMEESLVGLLTLKLTPYLGEPF